MPQFLRALLLALVMLMVALLSALTAMQLAIHGREVAIPKLVGMTLTEAERATNTAGLQIAIERQFYSTDVPEGRIMIQMPPAGTKVRRGWMVRVAQSLGPQRVAIPDVTGESERVAELNIKRRSLDLASVAQANLPDTSADQVVAQSPPANASGVAAPKISLLCRNPARNLCNAGSHRATAGKRDSGVAGCGPSRGTSHGGFAAGSGRRTAASFAQHAGQFGEHDRHAESGSGTESCGGHGG